MFFKLNAEKEKNEIERLIISETKPRSAFDFLKLSGTYKGKIPILIVVSDTNDSIRAKNWCNTLQRLTKAHVKFIHSIHYSFEIEAYIEEYKIQSLFILDIGYTKEGIFISSRNAAIQSFLIQSFSVESHQFSWSQTDIENLPIYSNTLTALVRVGKEVDLPKLCSFLSSMIGVIPKLSLFDESQILMKTDGKVKQNIPYNRIELNPTFITQNQLQENDYVVIYNPLNFLFTVACVKSISTLGMNEITTSNSISKKLKIAVNGEIVLHPLERIIINRIVVQNASQLVDGDITISKDIDEGLTGIGADYFEIVNRVTSASFDIERSKIRVNSDLASGTIQLSYMQREFLDLEHPPDTLSKFYYDEITETLIKQLEPIDFIQKQYEKQKVREDLKFEDKQKLKKLIKQAGFNNVAIYPLFLKPVKKKRFSLSRLFFNVAIRPATLQLNVIRPYSTDESSNIVRMSKSAMNLLGIAENDLVILNYRGKSIEVPVLEFDSPELVKETNIVTNESSINISIGIPAHLRFKLGIKQIGKICEIERNLSFLFKKNLSLQFIPILAAAFAVFSLNELSFWNRSIIAAIIVPISSYITLSVVREKIPKTRRTSWSLWKK
jgi:hypothetical protein